MQSVLACGRIISRAFVNGVIGLNVPNSTSQSSTNPLANSGDVSSFLEENKRLKFVTAVSGFAKYQPPEIEKAKAGKFGDDAYFISNHNKDKILGVADGVGGWRAWGIDPGEFSYSLMRACERTIYAGKFNSSDPTSIVAKAYNELLDNKCHILGSSTACIVVLQSAFGKLCSSNIGDSGFLVIRNGSVVHRSQEQQHYFNTPFQLSVAPPGVSNTQVLSDRPESASTQTFDIVAGDMLMLATDGVFDNLPVSAILKELHNIAGTRDTDILQNAANAIAEAAQKLAFDEDYMSPFALSARKNGINATGGKPDDITIILASVLA